MERVVKYKGVSLASFEWVGVPEQDLGAATAVVEAAFKAWPDKYVPAYPRLQLIARVLSASARAPYGQDPESVERDRDVETRIEATYLHARGLRKLERIYQREVKEKRAALDAANAAAAKNDEDLAAGR